MITIIMPLCLFLHHGGTDRFMMLVLFGHPRSWMCLALKIVVSWQILILISTTVILSDCNYDIRQSIRGTCKATCRDRAEDEVIGFSTRCCVGVLGNHRVQRIRNKHSILHWYLMFLRYWQVEVQAWDKFDLNSSMPVAVFFLRMMTYFFTNLHNFVFCYYPPDCNLRKIVYRKTPQLSLSQNLWIICYPIWAEGRQTIRLSWL